MNQSELEANTCRPCQARENTCEQITIGFGFTSDWSRKWRETFLTMTKRSDAKPKQLRNYFLHSIEKRSKQDFGSPVQGFYGESLGDEVV